MKKPLVLMTAGLLGACASGSTAPPPLVTYVPAIPIPLAQPAAQAGAAGPPATLVNPIPTPEPTRYKSHEAATAAASRAAVVDARSGTFEGETLNYLYRTGQRYKLVLDAPSHEEWQDAGVTQLFLGPGDGSEPGVFFDDPTWFTQEKLASGIDQTSMRAKRDRARQVSDGKYQTIVTLKCWKPGAVTNASVTTPQRPYLLRLHCATRKGTGGYNATVQFTSVGEQGVPPAEAFASAEAPVPAGSGPVVKDTGYAVSGPAEFRPREWAAWNDGADTHVRPPDSIRTRPVPMLPPASQFGVDPQTGEYFIRGLPAEIRFPWGPEQQVVVRRTTQGEPP